jgi:PAS domain-containing protein
MSERKICVPGGEIIYFQGFLEDITERKAAVDALQRAEERYRTIFQSSLVMTAVTQAGIELALSSIGPSCPGIASVQEDNA